YPARWRLTVPSASLLLELQPRLADQELMVGTRYWEGAVAVTGSGAAGAALAGHGYVELVGDAEGAFPPRSGHCLIFEPPTLDKNVPASNVFVHRGPSERIRTRASTA